MGQHEWESAAELRDQTVPASGWPWVREGEPPAGQHRAWVPEPAHSGKESVASRLDPDPALAPRKGSSSFSVP